MSTKIKRRLRTTPEFNFESETLSSSSPIKVDKASEKKVRRKKIRSTQDFNQLSSSLTEDSDSSSKIKMKRTKKTNRIYHLPKIDNVVGDSISGSLPNTTLHTSEAKLRRKSKRKISQSQKSNDVRKDQSDDIYSKVRQLKEDKVIIHIKSEINLASNNTALVDINTCDSEIQSCKVKMKNDNLEQKLSNKEVNTDKYQSENFVLGDQTYSEGFYEGKRIKPKKALRKKNKSCIVSRISIGNCTKTNMNNSNLTSKESSENNSSSDESPIKPLRQTRSHEGQRCVSSRLNAKQADINDINDAQQSKNEDSFIVLVSKSNKKEKDNHNQSVSLGKKSNSTNLNSSDKTFSDSTKSRSELKEKRNTISIRGKSLASDLSTSPVKYKKQKKRSSDHIEFIANRKYEGSSGNTEVNTILSGRGDEIGYHDVFDKTSTLEEKDESSQEIYRVQNSEYDLNNSPINITFPVKSKKQKKRSIDTLEFIPNKKYDRFSGNTITMSDLDDEIYADDVFDETSTVEGKNKRSHEIYRVQKKQANTECDLSSDLSNNTKIEARKSVRFLSPKEKRNILRNTYDLEESTFDLTMLKSMEENFQLNEVSSNYRDTNSVHNKTSPSLRLSQNSTKCNEADKSLVSNESEGQNNVTCQLTPLKVNISQDKSFIDRSLKRNTTQNRIFDASVSTERKVLKSKNKDITMELPSPIYVASQKQLKKDIYNDNSEDFVVSTNISPCDSKNMTLPKLSNKRNRSFQMENMLNSKQSVIDLITPETSPFPKSIHKNSSVICLEEVSNKKTKKDPSVMKLNRQSTFTKTSENELKVLTPLKLNSTASAVKQKPNLFDQNYDSPLGFNMSTVKNIDTSKVNKRKRWNKSQVDVSFLDSTYIEDISAPWDDGVLNRNDLSGRKTIQQSPIVNRTPLLSRTSPLKSSTPLLSSKNVLLRQAILKEKQNVSLNKSKSLGKVAEKPVAKLTRKQMPNFALIHQRAYDKMESLKEMSERKAVRAKLLLSGHKPTSQNTLKSPSKSKKALQFSPAKSISSNKCNNILVTKIKKISPSKSNLKVANKENKLTLLEKKKLIKPTQIPRLKVPDNKAEKKGLSKYGFKIGSNRAKTTTNEEQVKAILNKTKIMKNTVDERRNVIQGVRSNRRFELLMCMRNK